MKADIARQRVVLDTNVWISAALSASGSAGSVVRFALAHRRPVFSPQTFAELESRLWRPKFDRYLDITLRQRLLHDIGASADWVKIPPDLATRCWCRDPDDDAFIRTALASRAPLLVSGDADLLVLPSIDGVRILTPAQALADWTRA